MNNDVLAPIDFSDHPLYQVRHAQKTVESPAGELTILRGRELRREGG